MKESSPCSDLETAAVTTQVVLVSKVNSFAVNSRSRADSRVITSAATILLVLLVLE